MSESNSNSNSKSSSKKPGGGNGGGRRGRGGGGGRGGSNGRGRGGGGGGRGRGKGRGRGRSSNNSNNNRGGAATGDGYREGDTCKLAYKTTGEEPLELQQLNDNNSLIDDDDGNNSTSSMDHHHCLVCYSPTLHTSRGITPCNHDTICASCHLRLRSLLGDTRCPICKATNDTIIIDTDPDHSINEHKSYEQYERWGDDLGPNFVYHDDVQMFFPVAYYHRVVVPLFSLRCNVRGCNYGNNTNDNDKNSSSGSTNVTLKGLNHHLAAAHSLSLCQLCVENKRDFISRLPRYTPNQLKDHNKYGDIIPSNNNNNKNRERIKNEVTNAKGHPLCQFCAPKRFYDLTALHEHLNKDHYKCHICEKLGLHNQFFRDYHKLSMHFEKEHYLCPHPDCLAARFIVFANEIDLIAHERDVHNIVGGGRAINIEFNYRPSGRGGDYIIDNDQVVPDLEDDFNYGLNGEVFVPEALEDGEGQHPQQVNEPEITHGPHAERTALLREQARKRREELGLGNEQKDDKEAEAFPALGSSSSGNNLRWSAATASGGTSMVTSIRGRNTTALTDENFPSLGGGQAKKKSTISSKLRVTRGGVGVVGGGGSRATAMSLAAVARGVGPTPSYASSRAAITTMPAYYSSNVASMNSAANLTSNNFPSLGGGSSSVSSRNSSTFTASKYGEAQALAKKNLSADNFPSLGSNTGSNATVQAFSKKKKNSIFDPPKKAPALDNVLDFPAPLMSSSVAANGAAQVDKMKKTLGQAKYKELKKLTKQFATNDLDPESYVSSAVHLFEKGIEDEHFWEFVPSLISSCPNESSSKRAKRYLDSMRYPVFQAEQKQNRASTSNNASMNRSGSGNSGGWSDHVSSIQNSFQRAQPKKKSAWAAASQTKKLSHNASAKINSSVVEGAREGPRKGTATKYMAKERAEEKKMKQIESEAQQGGTGKKKKATAKKNELRELAFGKN